MPCGVEPRKLIDSNVVGWRQLRQIRGNDSILLELTNFTCAPSTSRDCADERAFHLLLNTLHRTSADAALARDLAYAFATTQMRLDVLFKRGIDPRPAERHQVF